MAPAKPRILWATTHVTLRLTELPIFIEAGFEVVPEEANLTVLSYLEAQNYDNSSWDYYPKG